METYRYNIKKNISICILYMLFCVKCRKKTESKDLKQSTTKNNLPIMKGVCVICGTQKNEFIKSGKGLVRDISKNLGKNLPDIPKDINDLPVLGKLANKIY